jgi:hypothetical protein
MVEKFDPYTNGKVRKNGTTRSQIKGDNLSSSCSLVIF